MTRDLRLKFCLLCVNRQFNHDKGVICRLTDKQADFIEDCKDFRIDDREYKRISVEKINEFGLADKKGFLKELIKESNIDYHLTTKFLLFKPREQKDLGPETYFQKSKVWYGLLTLIPLTFFILTFFQKQAIKEEPVLIGLAVLSMAVIGWIIYDYFNNKNDFIVSDKGFIVKGLFIPWKIILGTMIKTERFRHFHYKYLVLITATKEDIEIKLNGLKGATESIGNTVEFYKERFRVSNTTSD